MKNDIFKKICIFLLVFFIIIILIIAVYFIRNLLIINNIYQLATETSNSDNYSYVAENYNNGSLLVSQVYFNDGNYYSYSKEYSETPSTMIGYYDGTDTISILEENNTRKATINGESYNYDGIIEIGRFYFKRCNSI